jgi:TFIIF-interacting CTD phosphatase-like protein
LYAGTLFIQRNTGWKYQKRPGVDALLVALLDHFEIVLFTSENAMVSTTKVH